MILISQQSPKWNFKTIGNSKTTIGAMGCTICGLSMLSDYFGGYKDPAWMSKNLQFMYDKVIWKSIDKVLNFNFVWRGYKYDEKVILDALKDPKKACLLEIRKAHWVVGIKKVPLLGYWVADPWPIGGSRHFYPVSYISGFSTFKMKL